jgi:hypothetical protein
VRSAQVLAVRALLLGSLLASAGCFRPKVLSYTYACPEAGPCPDGLVCNAIHICAPAYDAGVPGTGGGGGKVGTGGTGGKGGTGNIDGGGIDRPCTGAIASCRQSDAGTGICDPVCNRGCGECYQKCSVNTTGDLTCNQPYQTNATTGGLLKACSQYSVAGDPASQTDNCQPGQLCISASTCGPRCYQFCRGDSDCTGGASCSRDGGTYQFCDIPPTKCDPLPGGKGMTDCGGLSCYLSQDGMNTLCDCQFDRAGLPTGVGRIGDPCNHSRDCLTGNVCAFFSATVGKKCEPVCLLPVDGGTDNCPGSCQLLQASGGSIYGWCNQ